LCKREAREKKLVKKRQSTNKIKTRFVCVGAILLLIKSNSITAKREKALMSKAIATFKYYSSIKDSYIVVNISLKHKQKKVN